MNRVNAFKNLFDNLRKDPNTKRELKGIAKLSFIIICGTYCANTVYNRYSVYTQAQIDGRKLLDSRGDNLITKSERW